MRTRLFLVLASISIFFSCASSGQEDRSAKNSLNNKTPNELTLVFCGDVMAHTQNFRMRDYSIIWDGVRDLTSNSDFTFANIEAPVNDEMPFLNYPNFNMQSSYPQAAIDAGINVITTANNHTNDHFETGIQATSRWAEQIQNASRNSKRPIYVSGLKQDVSSIKAAAKSDPTFCHFSKGKYTILFLGVTQLLNTQGSKEMINYYPGSKAGNQKLIDTVKKLREDNPCDIFVLALHTDEVEYVLEVTESRKKFYKELLDAGVDILWANHPHVIKPVEYIKDSKTDKIRKVIFYAAGNTISGQRRNPHFDNPSNIFDYTGDGIITSLKVKKDSAGIFIDSPVINYITTYVDKENNYLIKKLDQTFYDELEQSGQTKWKKYLIEREKLVRDIKEITTWQ